MNGMRRLPDLTAASIYVVVTGGARFVALPTERHHYRFVDSGAVHGSEKVICRSHLCARSVQEPEPRL